MNCPDQHVNVALKRQVYDAVAEAYWVTGKHEHLALSSYFM